MTARTGKTHSSKDLLTAITAFLELRVWLIGRFGIADEALAQAAIRLYRETVDPHIVQIHVRVPNSKGVAKSFVIISPAQNALWGAGFLRWRYASVEEASGQYRNPTVTQIQNVWTENGAPFAVLFATTTEIAGKHECTSFFVVRRDLRGQWRLLRSYLLQCELDSRAWQRYRYLLGAL